MTAHWLVAATCLVAAAVVLAWPRRGRPARLLTTSRPAERSLQARVESLSGPRAMTLAVALAALAGTLVSGPVAGVVAGGYGAIAVRTVLRRRATRAAAAMRTRSLDALCGLAADLRAGLPAAAAAPVADGTPLGESFAADPATGPGAIEDRRMAQLAGAAWRLAERTGAPIADLIERIEADARAMDRASAAAAAQAAGARATAWLLAGLPVGGIALGYSIGADPLAVLLHTPIGAACAAGAITLQVAGLAWADRIASVGTARPEPAPRTAAQARPPASEAPSALTGSRRPAAAPPSPGPATASAAVPASAPPSRPAVVSPPSPAPPRASGMAPAPTPSSRPAVASPAPTRGSAVTPAPTVPPRAKPAPPAWPAPATASGAASTMPPRPAAASPPPRAGKAASEATAARTKKPPPAPMPAEPSRDPLWTAVGLTTPWPESAAPVRADRTGAATPGRPKPHPLPRAAAGRSGAVAADRAEPGSEA